ncbi:MAG: type II toxin-antitoxin system HicB family antitoxin [Terriglobia bacterium]
MKNRGRYLKIVEWSEEDQCYVGRCPGLMFGGIHGDDEQKVFRELCGVVDEWIETIKKDGKPLPKATANKEYSGRFLLRVGNELHRALAVRALEADQSLNNYTMQILRDAVMPGGTERKNRRKPEKKSA